MIRVRFAGVADGGKGIVLTGLAFADYLPFGRPDFSDQEIEAATRVLRSGWIGMGSEVLAFEEELAAYLGVPHVVTVNSCTSALFLALLACGIGEGDEVICPSFTWCATANAALYLGARPVFCDVDPDTLCVTPELVRQKLSPKTRAVMVVHFGGWTADVKAIRSILPDGVALIEDAAHAFGAEFPDGRRVGASGNLTCFSFYANKNLSTGEGGAVALFDAALADRLRSLRQNALPANAWTRFTQAQSLLYSELSELGYKMNFIDLLAGIGRVQLRRQSEFQRTRLRIAEIYHHALDALPGPVRFQQGILSPRHSRHLFPVQLPLETLGVSRDEFVLQLRTRNIGATIHYAPLHSMPLYAPSRPEPLPATERIAKSILTLPIGARMGADDASRVAEHFRDVFLHALREGVADTLGERTP